MSEETSKKHNRNQMIAMTLLILLSVVVIILRIRKMIHLNMIGEDASGMDWFMLALWTIVAIINAIEVEKRLRKKTDSPID